MCRHTPSLAKSDTRIKSPTIPYQQATAVTSEWTRRREATRQKDRLPRLLTTCLLRGRTQLERPLEEKLATSNHRRQPDSVAHLFRRARFRGSNRVQKLVSQALGRGRLPTTLCACSIRQGIPGVLAGFVQAYCSGAGQEHVSFQYSVVRQHRQRCRCGAARWSEDLLGFYVMWHLYGGFEGLQRAGLGRSTVYRKLKRFRVVYGDHPDGVKIAGINLDIEAFWESRHRLAQLTSSMLSGRWLSSSGPQRLSRPLGLRPSLSTRGVGERTRTSTPFKGTRPST